MKIAYLHGLLSNNIGEKNEWLRTISKEVYDPLIKYMDEEKPFERVYNEVKKFQPDVIIGSSMGGYFAYEIGRRLDIPTLLFNPALHSRSVQPDMTGEYEEVKFKPRTHLILGEKDDLIDPQKTIEMIEDYITYEVLDHAHRTSFKLFKDSISEFIKK